MLNKMKHKRLDYTDINMKGGSLMYNKENTREAEEILGRISDEMKKQNKKQAELIRFLNLPTGTFTNWKLRKSRNFCEHLQSIAQFLKVDAGWLLTGQVREGETKDDSENELLEAFRQLNTEKQTAVIQNVRWLTK